MPTVVMCVHVFPGEQRAEVEHNARNNRMRAR